MRVGLRTTAIFGDLSGYFFGIFRDKASRIICGAVCIGSRSVFTALLLLVFIRFLCLLAI